MTITSEFRAAIAETHEQEHWPACTITAPGLGRLARTIGLSDPTVLGPVLMPLPNFILLDPLDESIFGRMGLWCAETRLVDSPGQVPHERAVRFVRLAPIDGRFHVLTRGDRAAPLATTNLSVVQASLALLNRNGRVVRYMAVNDEFGSSDEGFAPIAASCLALFGGLLRKRDVEVVEVATGRSRSPEAPGVNLGRTYVVRRIEQVVRRALNRAGERERSGRKVRAHHVIGYWRCVGTEREHWVDSYLRGDLARGFVEKDYRREG